MTQQQALEAIRNGNIVKGSALGTAEFIYMDDNNRIVSSRGKFFNMESAKEQNWTIYTNQMVKREISLGGAWQCCVVGHKSTPNRDKNQIIFFNGKGWSF